MPLPVVCPACNHKFNVPDKYAGKRGKCPECASVFRAPTPEELLVASGVIAGATAEPPPVETEPIPVGIAIEPDSAPPLVFDPGGSPPAPAFIAESRPASTRPSSARPNYAKPKPELNLLLIGGGVGGVLLAVVVVAGIIWVTSDSSDQNKVAIGKGKKQAKAEASREVDVEDSDAANTNSANATPAPRVPGKPMAPDVPNKSPEPKPGEDLGALPEFEKPEPVVPPPTVPAPSPLPEVKSLSAESIQGALDECDKLAWKPADREQYAKLQELARLVTLAEGIEGDPSLTSEERAAIAAASQAVLEKLAGMAWISDADIGAVNRLAAESFKESEMGVFAYGTVVGSIPNLPQLDGRNLLIFELGGTMETVVVPVKTPLEDTPQGTRWVILGQRNPTSRLGLTMVNNGVERKVVPAFVNTSHLIGEPKRE